MGPAFGVFSRRLASFSMLKADEVSGLGIIQSHASLSMANAGSTFTLGAVSTSQIATTDFQGFTPPK